MTKVTLDMDTFKALASDTRLDILRTLDGKKMSLKDISSATKLNKATLHEHLAKLNEAGLVKKKEREGHKWVVYKLTWKGESLLHPENTRIVVMFTTTFIALWVGIIQMIWYIKGTVMNLGYKAYTVGNEIVMTGGANEAILGETMKYATSDANDVLNFPPNLPEVLKDFLINKGYYSSDSSSIPLGQNYTWVGTSSDGSGSLPGEGARLVVDESQGVIHALYQNPMFLYIAVVCFAIFTIVLCVSLWRLWENKTLKL